MAGNSGAWKSHFMECEDFGPFGLCGIRLRGCDWDGGKCLGQGIARDKLQGPFQPKPFPSIGDSHQAHRSCCSAWEVAGAENETRHQLKDMQWTQHPECWWEGGTNLWNPVDQQLLPGWKGHSVSLSSGLELRHSIEFMAW